MLGQDSLKVRACRVHNTSMACTTHADGVTFKLRPGHQDIQPRMKRKPLPLNRFHRQVITGQLGDSYMAISSRRATHKTAKQQIAYSPSSSLEPELDMSKTTQNNSRKSHLRSKKTDLYPRIPCIKCLSVYIHIYILHIHYLHYLCYIYIYIYIYMFAMYTHTMCTYVCHSSAAAWDVIRVSTQLTFTSESGSAASLC